MSDEEIIEKIMNGKWWPFDRVEPHILKEVMRREKQTELNDYEEAPL